MRKKIIATEIKLLGSYARNQGDYRALFQLTYGEVIFIIRGCLNYLNKHFLFLKYL